MCGGCGVRQSLIGGCDGFNSAALVGRGCALECGASVTIRLETVADLLTELIRVVPDDRLREPTTDIDVCIWLRCKSALVIEENCLALERTYSITGVHTIRVCEKVFS